MIVSYGDKAAHRHLPLQFERTPMDIPARATLINKKSGLALDIMEYDMSDGGWVIQWTPHGKPNQIFRLEPAEGGYKFIAEHSGKALDVTLANQNSDFAMQWG
ncbi:RICIN domain-containing protein, partial [Nonomuraea sp. NPDC005701]